jgi:hypothetical protein
MPQSCIPWSFAMSFQAYIDNIKEKTGKTPEDFREAAQQAGLLKPGLKASEFVDWLKMEYDLGTGHARAIWHVFVSSGWVEPKKTNMKKKRA